MQLTLESILCMLAGVITVSGAIALSFLRSPQWHSQVSEDSPRARILDVWARFQRGVRRSTNCMLAAIGVGVFAGAFVPEGRIKLALWLFIFLGLLTVLFLAALDALASTIGYREAVPETARRTLTRYKPHP